MKTMFRKQFLIFGFFLFLTLHCNHAEELEDDVGKTDKEGLLYDYFYNFTDAFVSKLLEDDDSNNSSVMKIQNAGRKFVDLDANTNAESIKTLSDEENTLRWVSYPLREGLRDFVVQSENPECKRDIELYKSHLRNQTLWAVRMQESTQSEPVGLLGGTTYQMGSYEECVKTVAYGLKGKYCLAKFRYSMNAHLRKKFAKLVPDDDYGDINYESSVWEALVRLEKDPVRVSRNNLFWGLCLPASCSHTDLQQSLNDTLVPLFHRHSLELDIVVDPLYCNTGDKLPFTRGFYIMISFMCVLLATNVFSTLYDGYEYLRGKFEREPGGCKELFAAFSIYRNVYNLGIYNKNSQVKLASAMKVVMMLLIIYGHTLMYLLGYPHFHPQHLEDVYRRGADIALVNTNIVDVFFTISGFITFYYGFHPMKIGGVIYLILSIVFRYLRLMPVFALLIGYVTFVMPYTSDGPIWRARIMPEVENCKENWWLDLLLMNNFVNSDKACILVSWYITNDMLLCMMASVLIYAIARKPKFGLFLTLMIFIGSIVVTYSVTYINKYGGLLKLYMSFLEEPRRHAEFSKLYTAIYARAGPYLVGFLAAYLTVKLQEMKFKFSLKQLVIGSILVIAVGEASQYYGVVFYKYGRPYYPIENALYSSLHRVLFGILFSFLLMVYLTTGYGILDPIVNHRIWTVFGRLTYSVFLMNTISLMTLTASTRTPWFASYKFIMFIVFGDMITTYVLGFLFYLYAEAPVCAISKLLQKSLARMFEKEIEKAKLKAGVPAPNGNSISNVNGNVKMVV